MPLPIILCPRPPPLGTLSGAARAAPAMPDQSEKEAGYLAEATCIEVLLCVEPSTKHFRLQWLFHFSQQLFTGGFMTSNFENEEKQTIRC